MRIVTSRGACLWATLLAAGCTRGAPTGAPPVVELPPPSATAAAAAPTPDQILQARLREAARRPVPVEPEAIPPAPEGQESPAPPGAPSQRLPPAVIQAKVRSNFGLFRQCYEAGLARDPKLAGKVAVKFTIQRDGSVTKVNATGDLKDKAVIACVAKNFSALSFPKPEGGLVTVTYPIMFSPGDDAPAAAASSAPTAPAPPPPAPPPPAPAPAAPGAADADETWPIVVIEGGRVLVDGTLVGATEPILTLGRLQKLDELFNVLKARREAWQARHPSQGFPGVLGLRAAPDTALLVWKSVFQTAAFAGFPGTFLQLSTEPSRILEVRAQVPLPPSHLRRIGLGGQPDPVQSASVEGADVKLVWKVGATVIAERTVPVATLSPSLCQDWKLQGKHRDPADAQRDTLIVHADSALALRVLLPILDAVEACKRPMAAAGREAAEVPVFEVYLSVR